MVAVRTREDVLADLAAKTHRAGRMTVKSTDYESIHDAINALLDELAVSCD